MCKVVSLDGSKSKFRGHLTESVGVQFFCDVPGDCEDFREISHIEITKRLLCRQSFSEVV